MYAEDSTTTIIEPDTNRYASARSAVDDFQAAAAAADYDDNTTYC